MTTRYLGATGFDFGATKAVNAADATAATDLATWGQVQNLINAVTHAFHAETRAAGNTDISQLNNGDTVGNEVVVTGDVVLLDRQTTAAEDGLYIVGATAGSTVRHPQLAAGDSWEGIMVRVSGGDDGGKTFFSTGEDLVVGTDGVTMVESVAGVTYTFAQGTQESAGTVTARLDGSTLSQSSSGIKIADGGVAGTQLAASVAGAGLTGGAGSALAVGAGTGIIANANDVAIDTGVVSRWFSNAATHSAGTTVSLTHNLGRKSYHVSVCINSTGEEILADVVKGDNSVTVTFGASQSANTILLSVIG